MLLGTKQKVEITSAAQKGNLLLLGRSGTGKSVQLENIVLLSIKAGKAGIIFDPYGDLIKDLLSYLPKNARRSVKVFKAQAKKTWAQNFLGFKQGVKTADLKNKFILCDLGSMRTGEKAAVHLGSALIKYYYSQLKSKSLAEKVIVIDEINRYMSVWLLKQLAQHKKSGAWGVLCEQGFFSQTPREITQLAKLIEMVITYQLDAYSAKILGKKFKFKTPLEQLKTIPKYHFIAKLKQQEISSHGLYPLNF